MLPVVLCLLCAWSSILYGMEAPMGKPKKGFTVPLHRRAGQARRGRMLGLRNSSYPLHGTVKDLGYFYATIYIGSPARQFAVIVDTGSTITYVPCASCGSNCGKHKDEAFDPATSSTFRSISCADPTCLCGNPSCQCVSDKCFYARHYAEQSSSEGFLIEDMFHFQDGAGAVPIRFGCETRETGEIFRQEADGIMGLGNSDASIINQLVGAKQIDDVFSMCFGSVEGDGVLLMGDVELPADIPLQYTNMVPTRAHYYLVKLEGILLAGQMVNVRQGLYDIGYGVVLDSGTTFSYLPSEAYSAFLELLEKHAKGKGLKRTTGPDPRFANTDICWGGAPTIEQAHRLQDKFPVLQLNFGGGVQLSLHPLNYLFMHTRESGAYCLGIFDNGHQGTLLGGITFRNVLIQRFAAQYDRRNQRVGFGYAACQRLGMDLAPPCDVISSLQGDTTGLPLTDCRPLSSDGPRAPGAAPQGAGAPPPPPPTWTPSAQQQQQQQTAQPDGGGGTVAGVSPGDLSGGAPGSSAGGAAARPGAEDGALRSEEEIDGEEGIPFSRAAAWLGSLSALQLLLLSTSIALTAGAVVLGVLHLVTYARDYRARRGSTAGTSNARYQELTNVSPAGSAAGSDDEGDGGFHEHDRVCDTRDGVPSPSHATAPAAPAAELPTHCVVADAGGALLPLPGEVNDDMMSVSGRGAGNWGIDFALPDSRNPFLQPAHSLSLHYHGSPTAPDQSCSVATVPDTVDVSMHEGPVLPLDSSNPFVDVTIDSPQQHTNATNPFLDDSSHDLLGLQQLEGDCAQGRGS